MLLVFGTHWGKCSYVLLVDEVCILVPMTETAIAWCALTTWVLHVHMELWCKAHRTTLESGTD